MSLFFTRREVILSFTQGKRGHALALGFFGANPRVAITGSGVLPGRVNYLLGSDPSKWRTGIPTYRELVYRELWPGIDLALRGVEGQLKYEFRSQPGASLEQIRLVYAGAENLALTRAGALAIETPLGVLTDARPVSYQRIGGKQQSVTSGYRLVSSRAYGFEVAGYDSDYPLVIDPGLAYSTFLGGADYDDGRGGIAVDGEGNTYVAGRTNSPDFPATPGAFDTTHNNRADAFVAKLNAAGSALVYSTFLGGSDWEEGLAMAVDYGGHVYVTGNTSSADFPITPGAFDSTFNGHSDVFVTKLDAAGSSLVYSTFLGGAEDSEFGIGIAVEQSGKAYMTGITSSDDFPTTAGAHDTTYGGNGDAFVTKLNIAGSALAYSTFLGDAGYEDGLGIALDRAGTAYVTGQTNSVDFPTTPGAFDRSFNSASDDPDAYVTRFNAAGNSLVYSTFLGGALGEQAQGIAVDRAGNAYLTGLTDSGDFPTTADAFDRTFNSDTTFPRYSDGFVTKLNTAGSALVYSTFLGAGATDYTFGISVDRAGSAYVAGDTHSPDFPTTPGAFDTTYNGGGDGFVTKLNAAGSALAYSTFLGGSSHDQAQSIALDRTGKVYVTGDTESADFPTTERAFDRTHNGGDDGFVTKVRL